MQRCCVLVRMAYFALGLGWDWAHEIVLGGYQAAAVLLGAGGRRSMRVCVCACCCWISYGERGILYLYQPVCVLFSPMVTWGVCGPQHTNTQHQHTTPFFESLESPRQMSLQAAAVAAGTAAVWSAFVWFLPVHYWDSNDLLAPCSCMLMCFCGLNYPTFCAAADA